MPKSSVLRDEKRLREVAANAATMEEILQAFDLRLAGGNYATLRKFAEQYGIELPKFDYATHIAQLAIHSAPSNEEVFVENGSLHRSSLKKRLYKMGVPEECTECGIGNEWNGKPLSLQLEHINGVKNDNRLENLTILCPNCHSQTPTFAGRNKIKTVATIVKCIDCDKPVVRYSERCKGCVARDRNKTEGKYPPKEELLALVKEQGYSKTGREFGVSDNAVRKHLRKELGAEHPFFQK